MGIALILGGCFLITIIYLVSLIEALIYQKMLRIKKALEAPFLANLFTSIIGIFLIIFIHHYLNSTAFGKTLDEKLGDYFIGVIPTLPKSLYLDYIFFLLIYDVIPLIILYFIAVIIKYFVLKMYFKTVEKSKVKKSVWIANAVIYIILICFKIIIDINAEFYVPLFILSLIGMFFPLFLYGKFQKSVTH